MGEFNEKDLERFEEMFPTLYLASELFELRADVDHREVDLLVIGEDVSELGEYPMTAHTICFSSAIGQLPGPIHQTILVQEESTETEEYVLPEVPLRINRLRDAAYGNLSGIKGLPALSLGYFGRAISVNDTELAAARFSEGAIVKVAATERHIAVAFIREGNNLGMAWLPSVDSNRAAWVGALVEQWAQIDPVSFPYSDWSTSREWMTREEESITLNIEGLEERLLEHEKKTKQEIANLESELAAARAKGDKGIRRLITAQAEELAEAVALAFEKVGFHVENVDQSLKPDVPKREDLRLTEAQEDGDSWEAIVEVRGYMKSSHKLDELRRLEKFAGLYLKEKGRFPDKKIYVVNGQIELPPPGRQQPFEAARADLQSFAEDRGLVIWTIDLFRAMKSATQRDYGPIRQSIVNVVGLWRLGPE